MWYPRESDISALLGHTLTSVARATDGDEDAIVFESSTGERWLMDHEQDCCESVTIEDICGDLSDLVGSPILMAEHAENQADGPVEDEYDTDSQTWTFYKLATVKGYVTIRWLGSSNGYYSESVDFGRIDKEADNARSDTSEV